MADVAHNRIRFRRLKDAGKCGYCTSDVVPGHRLCAKHQAYYRQWSAKMRAKRAAMNDEIKVKN